MLHCVCVEQSYDTNKLISHTIQLTERANRLFNFRAYQHTHTQTHTKTYIFKLNNMAQDARTTSNKTHIDQHHGTPPHNTETDGMHTI